MNAHNEQQARALAELTSAAGLMLSEIDTSGHEVDPAYRATLFDAWEQGKAALAASPVVKQNLTTDAAAQEAVAKVGSDHFRSIVDWLGPIPPPNTLLYAAPVTAAPVGDLFVECRQCEECNHAGVNDSGDHLAACLACYWSGMAPDEDRCPECDQTGCMSAACPKCGARYKLVASAEFPASTPAAPTLDDELAQDRMSELCKLESDVLDVLPSVYYMDPPDGGDVSLGEQVKRMAEDAANWRKHASTPAAPGIDLPVIGWLHEIEWVDGWGSPTYSHGPEKPKPYLEVVSHPAITGRIFVSERFTPLIDASPKGALNEQFGSAEGLGSPKGGSDACERIAAILHKEATDEPWTVCGVEHDGPDRAYYRELARRVLDAAQAGDAEVQP